MLKVLIFDLDYTLYPQDSGPLVKVGRRIDEYMIRRLGIPPGKVPEIRAQYKRRYGISTRGLFLHHCLDTEDFTNFVHDVDIEGCLQPNPALAKVLERIEMKKVIFTNATTEYARRVLSAVGVEEHFQEIYDLRFMQFRCKPDPQPYRWLLEKLHLKGGECLFIEDNVRNLRPGKALGMVTVLVGEDSSDESVDYAIPSILQIGEIVEIVQQAPPHLG